MVLYRFEYFYIYSIHILKSYIYYGTIVILFYLFFLLFLLIVSGRVIFSTFDLPSPYYTRFTTFFFLELVLKTFLRYRAFWQEVFTSFVILSRSTSFWLSCLVIVWMGLFLWFPSRSPNLLSCILSLYLEVLFYFLWLVPLMHPFLFSVVIR